MKETGPVTKAVLAAIYDAFPRVCREMRLDGNRSRKMLRIEVADAAYMELRRENGLAAGEVTWVLYGKDEGPDTIHGVAIYAVRNLPSPGWRLINPLDHDRIISPAAQTPAERNYTEAKG